jgi:hypothetical protein
VPLVLVAIKVLGDNYSAELLTETAWEVHGGSRSLTPFRAVFPRTRRLD